MILPRARAVARRVAASRVARQFGGLTGGRAAEAALSFVWLALAARHLSISEFADLALILSVGAIMSVVSDAGLAIVLNEAVAADPARGRSTLGVVAGRRMLLAVGAALAMGAFYLLAANDRNPAIPAVFALSMLATALHTSCAAALRGALSVVPDAVNEVASRGVVLVVGGVLLVNGGGLLAAVAAYALADIASALILSVIAWRRLSPDRLADRARVAARRVLPLGLAMIAGVVYYRIDLWLLALLSDAGEVARYSVSCRIVDVLVMPAGALAMVMIGSTARLDDRATVARADRMVRLLCLCILPAVLVLVIAPGFILRLGFGAGYGSGGAVLRILALAVIPSIGVQVWGPLVALRHARLLSVTVSCLIGNVLLNLVLVVRIDGAGAALATVAGQVMFAVLLRLKLRDLVGRAHQPVGQPALVSSGNA